jgi:2-polyprenyl-6-methoxyphenol hydroxylase-like FAD-dependent oxidoreductase
MAGIDAAVYEARPADPTAANGIGGSLALEPNGLAALRIVDADDAVRAAAVPIARSIMSIASRPGREMPAPAGLPPRQLIDRGVLYGILRERAQRAGVRIQHGKKLIGIEESHDGVTAHFADGSSATADVLIGADGVHSTVRRLIDPDAPGARYLNLLGFEGLVDGDADDTTDLAPGSMTFAFGKRAYYLYWMRPDGRIGWGANLPSPQYLSLRQARRPRRRVAADTAYANDTPGARLASQTTSETLQAVGALHIMPPVPHWYAIASCWSATRCTRRPTAPDRAHRWRWKARSNWPVACATYPTCHRPSPRTNDCAVPGWRRSPPAEHASATPRRRARWPSG